MERIIWSLIGLIVGIIVAFIAKIIFQVSIIWFSIVCIGGALIGFYIGNYRFNAKINDEKAQLLAEESSEARGQRVRWAKRLRQMASEVDKTCSENASNHRILPEFQLYQSNAQMERILNEWRDMAILTGEVNAIANQMNQGGNAK